MSLIWKNSAGSTVTNGSVNEELTAHFTFENDDVRAVYIDWGDGESNKKEEANYQWLQYSQPILSGTATHTYTKQAVDGAAPGTMAPIVQTVNSKGFVSRYMGSAASPSSVVPYTRNVGISSITINDTAPTAIMKVENTTVKSGIDNSPLEIEGPKNVFFGIAPTVTKAELETIAQISVEIEAIINYNTFDAVTAVSNSAVVYNTSFASLSSQETILLTLDVSSSGVQSGVVNILNSTDTGVTLSKTIQGTVARILSFKYVSPSAYTATYTYTGRDYTRNEIFNRLKLFLYCEDEDNSIQANYTPLCYVTSGQPIKTVEDNERFITLDMTQSRAASSSASISNYRYDAGKIWFNPANQWELSTDILGTSTEITSGIKPVHYTYYQRPFGLNSANQQRLFYGGSSPESWYISGTASGNIRQDLIGLDDFGRIYDQYHIVRASAVASTTSGSDITTNQPDVLFFKGAIDWTSPGSITSLTVDDNTSAMKNNSSGDPATNAFILSNLNQQTIKDVEGTVVNNAEKDYIILLFDSKTNKVFFNNTNYTNSLRSDNLSTWDPTANGLHIAGVEYLHIKNSGSATQDAIWKPLEFKDTMRITREYRDESTDSYLNYNTTFAKSGYLSFSMPQDWNSIDLKNLYGGVYNVTGTPSTGVPVGGAGFADTTLVLSYGSTSSPSRYGITAKYTLDAASQTRLEALGDKYEIGAYKYAFIVTDSTTNNTDGAMYWVASGNNLGWDGTNQLHLQVGATGGAGSTNYEVPLGNISGSMRRINAYDALPGASKVFSDDGEVVAYANAELVPVGGDTYNYGSSYFLNVYNGTDAQLKASSWSGSAKYALKLTLSGTTGDGTAGNPAPEVWNIFDGNQGHGAIVKEIDDTAYNLNSLAITSDISLGRTGDYFKAITRKGKVYVAKTGIGLTTVGFSSVALGDENSSTAFEDRGPSSLYGHLHTIRRIQAEVVPVYWDEPQKDGTYLRIWGIVTDITETRGKNGPRAIMNYSFNLTIEKVAILTNTGELMTSIYPLGGIPDETTYS